MVYCLDLIEIHFTHWPFIRIRREQTLSSQAVGWSALLTMIIASSTYNTFAKPLTGVFSPLSLLFVSEILTLLFLLFSFGLVPIGKRLLNLPKKTFLPLLWVGILSGTLAPVLWFSGLQTTSAVNANLFGNAEMIFLILFAVLVLGERWTKGHAIAGCMIAAGIATVALEGHIRSITLHTGDALILLGSITFSIGSTIFRKYLHHLEPQIAIFARSVIAIATFLTVSLFLEHDFAEEFLSFPITLVGALLGFGFVARFLNIFTFYGAIERLPVSTVSLVGSLSVVTGVLFAHAYLNEPILWYHIVGGSLILLGTIFLETLGMHPSEAHHEVHLEQHHHHRG